MIEYATMHFMLRSTESNVLCLRYLGVFCISFYTCWLWMNLLDTRDKRGNGNTKKQSCNFGNFAFNESLLDL